MANMIASGSGILASDNVTKYSLDGTLRETDSNTTQPRLDVDLDCTTFDESDSLDSSSMSDCESSVSGPYCDNDPHPEFGRGLMRLDEGDRAFDLIKRRLVGLVGEQVEVVSMHKNSSLDSVIGQAKVQSFRIFGKATAIKCGGDANVKFAWYAGSKDELCSIVEHGFGKPNNNGLYGSGIYLSAGDSPMDSLKNLAVDKDGLRHLLFCRVILGKPEVVHPGSDQCHPSSEEFDSGVDNLTKPKKYIVWCTNMNTHILPAYIISLKVPSTSNGRARVQNTLRMPTSPWMPLPNLFSFLSKLLPPQTVALLCKYFKDYKEKKISRLELVQHVRQIAGDKLLKSAIKYYRTRY